MDVTKAPKKVLKNAIETVNATGRAEHVLESERKGTSFINRGTEVTDTSRVALGRWTNKVAHTCWAPPRVVCS